MGSYSYAVSIAAPPERVYDLYTDLDRVAEWQEGRSRRYTCTPLHRP